MRIQLKICKKDNDAYITCAPPRQKILKQHRLTAKIVNEIDELHENIFNKYNSVSTIFVATRKKSSVNKNICELYNTMGFLFNPCVVLSLD